MKYGIVLTAAVVVALAGCGGNDEQAQAQSPAIESTTPAGNAGPPPGAAPASGLGDANSAPTSAPEQPMPVDGSNVAADGTNAATGSDTTNDAMQTEPAATDDGTAPTPTPPTQ